jgi:Cu/Ag efflux pump CusA
VLGSTAALNTGVGSDVQRPLATVIVGGLISSLILTVMATPAIYYITHWDINKWSLEGVIQPESN